MHQFSNYDLNFNFSTYCLAKLNLLAKFIIDYECNPFINLDILLQQEQHRHSPPGVLGACHLLGCDPESGGTNPWLHKQSQASEINLKVHL